VQCVAGRVPAVRDLRAIIRREFDLPLTALRILSGSPNCETLSTAPASHAFLARGGPPDYEPRSQRAIADDFARIAYMDLCEELTEVIPREDPDAAKIKKETLDQLESPTPTEPSVNDVEIDLQSSPENQ
jgi:hypothetical protein